MAGTGCTMTLRRIITVGGKKAMTPAQRQRKRQRKLRAEASAETRRPCPAPYLQPLPCGAPPTLQRLRSL